MSRSFIHRYVSTELREISQEDLNTFLDDFNHYVFEMISSSDTNSKMGGILAIVVLINADVCNTGTRISRSHTKRKEHNIATPTIIMVL